MSSTTLFLNLELPGNGEYVDSWDQPNNENFTKIDAWAKDIQDEIQNARFGQSTLANFLSISINEDGSLKPTKEVINSRSSFIYGDEAAVGVDFDLSSRLNQSDMEVYYARDGYSDLKEANSVRSFKSNMVISGAKDVNGYPTWLGFTGTNTQIDGSVVRLVCMIGGYIGRVRSLEQISMSGSAGVKYIYAMRNTSGLVRVDGDSSSAPPSTARGVIGSDGLKVRIFEDSTIDFTSKNIAPGDILEILGTGLNAGFYQVAEVAPSGNINRLRIKGVFPGGSQASLNYNIHDPMALTLGFDDMKSSSENKLYIGEADWDGSSITAVRAIHFKDTFIGEWRAVDLTISGTFTEVWNHRLFDDALEVQIHVSQTNDGASSIEVLSLAQLNSTLAINSNLAISNTLALSTGTQSLSGAVSLTGSTSLTGSVVAGRSAKAYWTNKQVTVSNVTSNLLYKDFSGTSRQTGYIRVVVKKLRV